MSENRTLQLGVVGLGQCGGNFAVEFAARGYPALAVNTSQTDLRALQLDDAGKLYIGIEGMNGTGGSIELGGQCLSEKAEEILSVLGELGDLDGVLVISGLGGGTGGNLAALVDALATEDRPVVVMAILPASSESHATKVNALQAVNNLLDAAFETLIFVDNQKLYAAFANAGIDQFLKEGNAAVVQAFHEANALAADSELTSIRSLGPTEFRQTLLSGGVVLFGSRKVEASLSPETLVEVIQELVQNHPHLGSGYDLEDIVVLSSVVIADADVTADTPATVFEDFLKAVKTETSGATHHAGIYSGGSEGARLFVVAGGLSLPVRTQELLDEAAEEAERFQAKKAPRTKLKKLDLSGLSALAGGKSLDPPSTKGKGMKKSKAKGKGKGKEKEEESVSEPLVDLDFDDGEMVVEEEIVDDVIGDLDFEEKEK